MDKKVIINVPAPLSDNKKQKKHAAGFLLQTVEELFRWAWFPLPVMSGFPMLLLSVQEVFEWALGAAFCVAVGSGVTAAITIANIPVPCSQTSKILQCPDLTPAQGVEVDSFGEGILWLTVPQAAAAMVGLLLPCRHARSRLSLAFLAVVSATVVHYMIARMILILAAANPGDIGFKILTGLGMVILLAGDLLSLLSLVIGGPE